MISVQVSKRYEFTYVNSYRLIRERYEFVYVNSYRFSEAAVSGTTKIKASDRKSTYGNDPFSKLQRQRGRTYHTNLLVRIGIRRMTKKILSRKKDDPPCAQVWGNAQDTYRRNFGVMKIYLTKNQETHLKIEIILFQIEMIQSTPFA